MPLTILEIFKKLTKFEFRVLSVIEILMARHEFVPIEDIAKYMNYTEKRIRVTIDRMRKDKLVIVVQRHYLGIALTFIGYDALALKALVEKGVIAQVGPEIGAGKESDVRLALDDDGNDLILKFHRLGKLDFRATRKARSFLAEKRHLSPLYESRLSAEREYSALKALFDAGVSVPKPISQNRHIVAMHVVTGQDLFRMKKNEFKNPESVRELSENILNEIIKSAKAGYIHGDLSEYNIRLNEEDYPVLFDWPQYISLDSGHANLILSRDIENVLNYFTKKFKMSPRIEIKEIIDKIFVTRENAK
ncbi:MAG: serine/threonine protein kinase [Candidatus Heimdallarchaeota archaeon]|nr:serine/threonine protein kinase [Candidatus Heimdallarchaeota archaeon]